jgi:hypothetical protein
MPLSRRLHAPLDCYGLTRPVQIAGNIRKPLRVGPTRIGSRAGLRPQFQRRGIGDKIPPTGDLLKFA